MKEYILFQCAECGEWQAWVENKADGRRCLGCYGVVIPKDKSTKAEISERFQRGEYGAQEEMYYYG